jgi:RNA polymerase sigma-70 factor (ECF subfamily)
MTSETPDLSSLVSRIAAGDPQAESELVEHFAPRVRAMALVRTRDPDLAKDLMQETLLAVLQAFRKGQVRDSDRVAGFVCGVARNVINNHQRRSLKHPESSLDDETAIAATARDDDHDGQERRRLMARALGTLSPTDRQVLLLTLVDGLKPGQIAQKIGVSADVARTRKSRALKRILEVLEAQSQNAAADHLL